MTRRIDRLSDGLGTVAAWMFFAVGGMIVYEVVARYLFNAPTIWAEEMSRFFQIWATYLAAATLLRRRELIRITIVTDRLPLAGRMVAEAFALAVVALVSIVAIWWGLEIMLDSVAKGRTSATMLNVPQWWTEAAIPLGFALLLLQAVVEMLRLKTRAAGHDHDTELEQEIGT